MMASRGCEESEDDDMEIKMFIEEPFDPTKKPMYCKHKVYDNGQEFSLEEIRSRRYMHMCKDIQNIVNDSGLVIVQSKAAQNQKLIDESCPLVARGNPKAVVHEKSERKNPVISDALMDKENLPIVGRYTVTGPPPKSTTPHHGKLSKTLQKSGKKEERGNVSVFDDTFTKPSSNSELDVTTYTRAFNQPITTSTPFHGGSKTAGGLFVAEGRDQAGLKKCAIDGVRDLHATRAIKDLSTIEEYNSGSLGASSSTVSSGAVGDSLTNSENLNNGTVAKNMHRMPSIVGGGHTEIVKPLASRIPFSVSRMKSTMVLGRYGNDSEDELVTGLKSIGPNESIGHEVVASGGGGECTTVDRICKQFEEMAIVPDPFEGSVLDDLMKNLKIKVCNRIGYYLVPEKLPPVKGSSDLHLRKAARDGGHLFKALKLIGQGAYAKIYKADSTKWKKTVALKIQKPPCPWEFYISNEIHERVTDADLKRSFMNVKEACCFTDGSVLVSDYMEFGTLLDIINIYKMKRLRIPEVLVTYFILDVLRIIHCLHSCKIIHADIKPDNFLIKKLPRLSEDVSVCGEPSLQLIDFGRCIDMSLFPPDTCFNAVFQKTFFQCIEMRTKKPWTYQVDLFHIASLLHVLLFGEYMDVVLRGGVWSISKKVPRNLNQDLWNWFFNEMLNIESCTMLPNLCEITKKVENVYRISMVQNLWPALSTLKTFINEDKSKRK